MRLFKKKLEDVMDSLSIPHECGAPQPQIISNVLCTRDSYFHSCWLRMKLMHPDRIQEMGEIELFIAGLDSSDLKEETEEDEESEEDSGTII